MSLTVKLFFFKFMNEMLKNKEKIKIIYLVY
jgi:hypothetical protein